ncbi:MAG: caspase family protein [Rhodospirillales bacterium]|nr:caspase family protein [Rhodospirillales bacterium]
MRRLGVLLLALLVAAAAPATHQPPQVPFLRIEAGGHTSAIAHLAIDADGRLMASASYDKTIRLWSLPDGRLRAVLRPPIGLRQEGELYAVALSPDGSHVFAAGATGGQWDGSFSIYVFDAARAVLVSRLAGLPAPVNDLAVAPAGGVFAAGLAEGGVRVWNAHTGKPVFEDTHYSGPVRSVLFDRAGDLIAAAADGRVRVYDAAGKKLAEAAPPSHLRPWGLALSPDGALLAVTSETADRAGRLHIDVVATRTLAPVFTPDTAGLSGEGLLAAAWVADSHGSVRLLAGGYAHRGRDYVLRSWGDFGLGTPTDLPAAHDTIRAILALPGGGAVYAAEDPGWGRIAPDGAIAQRPDPPLADLRPARDQRLALSADGGEVEFASSKGLQRFTLASRTLAPAASPDAALAAARTTAPGLSLTNWRDTSAPALNGHRLPLDPDEIARSAAILPDNSAVLLGTDTHLRLFARDGHELSRIDTPAPAWAVSVAASGEVAVAALLDGTLRWYGLKGGLSERAALFAHADGKRWVLFTPAGFFDDSDLGGNDLVGLLLNRGANQQPDWVSFSQAYRLLYAPALVQASVLGQARPAQARLAELGNLRDRLARQPLVAVQSACLPQPDNSCTSLPLKPGETLRVPASATRLRLTAEVTQRGLGIGPLDVFVNDRNTGRTTAPPAGGTVSVDAPLDPGANTIGLRIYDSAGAIFTQSPPLLLDRAAGAQVAGRGRLFILSVGIDHYANPSLALHYAVADAHAFTAAISKDAASLYDSVNVTELLDGKATRADILAAFDRLSREVRPSDTFLFYVASHGVLDEETNRFLLVPADMSDISSWQAMARQSIDETTLVATLSRIEARDALLFLDTCHSGKVTADTLANVGHETGRYILAASGSVQEAMDSYDNRNGVFVYAVLEALHGRAGADADGNIGALTLGEYVSRRVGILARQKGHQQDAVFRTAQSDLRSFPVAHITR